MLGKLLKYELKASARTLLPLYAGTLLIALVCGVSMAIRVDNMNEFHQYMANGTAVTYGSFADPIDGGIEIIQRDLHSAFQTSAADNLFAKFLRFIVQQNNVIAVPADGTGDG